MRSPRGRPIPARASGASTSMCPSSSTTSVRSTRRALRSRTRYGCTRRRRSRDSSRSRRTPGTCSPTTSRPATSSTTSAARSNGYGASSSSPGGMNVGFVGLGRMGRGIAGRVLSGGHDLVVYNRTPDKAAELVEQGARAAASVADACARREVVISMLADDAALAEVALGATGIRDSLAHGATHLVMGTHGVAVIQELDAAHDAAGQTLVAGHVLGRPDLAASGQLGIVAAGRGDAVERCMPLFEVIGRHTFRAGEHPVGATSIKLANNFV